MSNWSKFEKGVPVFQPNGKIAKGKTTGRRTSTKSSWPIAARRKPDRASTTSTSAQMKGPSSNGGPFLVLPTERLPCLILISQN